MVQIIDFGLADNAISAHKSGSNQIELAQLLAGEVNSFLESVTFGRVNDAMSEAVQEKVDGCANELLNFLARELFDPEVSSESVGDWSRSYAHASQCTTRQAMYQIACRWLAGTGLMYCGV